MGNLANRYGLEQHDPKLKVKAAITPAERVEVVTAASGGVKALEGYVDHVFDGLEEQIDLLTKRLSSLEGVVAGLMGGERFVPLEAPKTPKGKSAAARAKAYRDRKKAGKV